MLTSCLGLKLPLGFCSCLPFDVSSRCKWRCIYMRCVCVHCICMSLRVYIHMYISSMTVYIYDAFADAFILQTLSEGVSPNWRSIFAWAFLQTSFPARLRQNTGYHCASIKSECLSNIARSISLHYCAFALCQSIGEVVHNLLFFCKIWKKKKKYKKTPFLLVWFCNQKSVSLNFAKHTGSLAKYYWGLIQRNILHD